MSKKGNVYYFIKSFYIVITIVGFTLSPITFGDDIYSNIPFAALLTYIFRNLIGINYPGLFIIMYIISNVFGIVLFYIGIKKLSKNYILNTRIKRYLYTANKKISLIGNIYQFMVNGIKLKFLISFLLLLIGIISYFYLESFFGIIFLVLGMIGILILLNIPSNWIEDSFATISHRLKISSLIAGGLFLAIASSSTEFFTSFSGVVWYKVFSIGFDTLVWSSLFNLCIILGVITFYKSKILISKNIINRDMPAFGISIGLLLFLGIDGFYTRWDFIFMIILYIIYILILYFDKSEPYQETTDDSWSLVYIKLFFGLLLIAVLAHTMVSFGQETVQIVDKIYSYALPIGILACTIYGPGTSIADMFMSIAAIKKGEDSASVVNSISSNTFDLTICMGVPGLIYTIITGENIAINIQSSILLISMLILSYFIVFIVIWDRKITKNEGIILILYYLVCTIIYIVYI